MLDANDKKWISNEIDTKLEKGLNAFEKRFDKKMDEKLDKRFDDFEKRFDKKMDEKLDKRFDDFKLQVDEKIDKAFNKIKVYFDALIENDIMPMINTHCEVLPGAHQSYEQLDSRVSDLEMKYNVLETAVKSRKK